MRTTAKAIRLTKYSREDRVELKASDINSMSEAETRRMVESISGCKNILHHFAPKILQTDHQIKWILRLKRMILTMNRPHRSRCS